MNGYLRTRDAARLLGVSESFLNQLRVRGGGPGYVKLGRKVVAYNADDLQAWASQRLQTSTSAPAHPSRRDGNSAG